MAWYPSRANHSQTASCLEQSLRHSPLQQALPSEYGLAGSRGQDIDKPGLSVDVAYLCGEDQGIHESGSVTPVVDACQAPEFAPDGFAAR